jgi:O-antigen/teichoic acid export membrane protein
MHSILGRRIGPEGYGTFSYALALAGVLSVIVSLGWPTALIRFMAQYMEQQQWGLLRGILLRAHQITFLSSVLVTLALLGAAYWLQVLPRQATSLRFAALLLPLLALVGLRRTALQGLQQVKTSLVPEDIALPLLVIGGATVFGVTHSSSAAMVYVGASLLVFIFGTILLWCSLPSQSHIAQPVFQTRKWMGVALPMLFGGISQIIMNRTDVLMLGAMVNMEAVGLYSAANRIAALNTFVIGAANTIVPPMLAAAYQGNRFEQFRTILYKTRLWSTIVTLPLFTVMVFWPHGLLSLFGSEFAKGTLLLQILAFGQFVNTATGPVGFALLMTGRERSFAWATALAATGNLLGNLIAIAIWGALGAAVVTAGCVVILNISMFYFVQRIASEK